LILWGEVQEWEYGTLGWNVLEDLVMAQEGTSGTVLIVDRPVWK
jgi:hypothetical protein